jgi:hypothetical protein
MLAWIPVYLPNVEVEEEDFSLPPAQHFILLLGQVRYKANLTFLLDIDVSNFQQDHKILAVLLESGGCTLRYV